MNSPPLLLKAQLLAMGAFIVLTLGLMADAKAQTHGGRPTLATWEIPGWVDSQGQGMLGQITKGILQRSGLDFDIRLYPPKRAAKMFEAMEVMGVFPATSAIVADGSNRSERFAQIQIHALYKQERLSVLGIGDMRGMRVGLAEGYAFPEVLLRHPQLRLDYAMTGQACMRKLLADRIDVFLDERRTLLELMHRFDPQARLRMSPQPVLVFDAYFAFQPGPAGQQIANAFNLALRQMHQDGSLGRILEGGSGSHSLE